MFGTKRGRLRRGPDVIVFTTERSSGPLVVYLDGSLEPGDDPGPLIDHLVGEAGCDELVIDLAGVSPPAGPGVNVFLAALAHARGHPAVVLVHPDLEARRALRAAAGGMPVVPFASDAVRQLVRAPGQRAEP